eukprot:g7537.t1 g7537   contig24:847294-848130(+)
MMELSKSLAYLAMTHLMLASLPSHHATTFVSGWAVNSPLTSSYRTTPQYTSSSTTSLHASRKGNRNPKYMKSIDNPSYAKRSRPQINDVLDGINELPSFPNSVDPADVPDGLVSDDPLTPLIHSIVHSADMRKASDIVALRVTSCTSLTNFVVIVSGTSRPQNQAIANSIAKDVEEKYDGKRCLGKGVPEGSADSGWILLDYGEVMVHVMTPKSRLFYDIEGQWKSRGGEYMDLSDVLVDEINAAKAAANNPLDGDEGDERSMKERLDVEKEEDPFWS